MEKNEKNQKIILLPKNTEEYVKIIRYFYSYEHNLKKLIRMDGIKIVRKIKDTTIMKQVDELNHFIRYIYSIYNIDIRTLEKFKSWFPKEEEIHEIVLKYLKYRSYLSQATKMKVKIFLILLMKNIYLPENDYQAAYRERTYYLKKHYSDVEFTKKRIKDSLATIKDSRLIYKELYDKYPELYFYTCFLFCTGLRPKEAMRLEYADIKPFESDDCYIIDIRNKTKTSKLEKNIKLHKSFFENFKEFLVAPEIEENNKYRGKIFKITQNNLTQRIALIKKKFEKAGLLEDPYNCTLYSMTRKACARCLYLLTGKDVGIVKYYLRHTAGSNQLMTYVYPNESSIFGDAVILRDLKETMKGVSFIEFDHKYTFEIFLRVYMVGEFEED